MVNTGEKVASLIQNASQFFPRRTLWHHNKGLRLPLTPVELSLSCCCGIWFPGAVALCRCCCVVTLLPARDCCCCCRCCCCCWWWYNGCWIEGACSLHEAAFNGTLLSLAMYGRSESTQGKWFAVIGTSAFGHKKSENKNLKRRAAICYTVNITTVCCVISMYDKTNDDILEQIINSLFISHTRIGKFSCRNLALSL